MKRMITALSVSVLIVFCMAACSEFGSFFISPVYSVPFKTAVWTVNSAEGLITGDSDYFYNYDPEAESVSRTMIWDKDLNTLHFPANSYELTFRQSLNDFSASFPGYSSFSSPLDYPELLFGSEVDITASAGEITFEDAVISFTTEYADSYALPAAAVQGIAGTTATEMLTGELIVISFNIESEEPGVSGTAVTVFSRTAPAGLLYLYYLHESGHTSLLYANEVNTEETGNYYPDGRYKYCWSIYETR